MVRMDNGKQLFERPQPEAEGRRLGQAGSEEEIAGFLRFAAKFPIILGLSYFLFSDK
jgi:hypothetical protein